jgi:ABC-type lipoprotein export system ATPase subunit
LTTVSVERSTLAECRGVSVSYGTGSARVEALVDVDLDVEPGERISLWGPSGSGKTTLLHVLGGLVSPTAGAAVWKGRPLSTLDVAARTSVRARGIAYVFQGANLIPHFTAGENVSFAARGADTPPNADPATKLLTLVGLAKKLDSLPSELSGGEAQRVAIARALAQGPELLLCDEPSGHLDSDTGDRVLDLVDALQQEFGFALITATHDPDVAARYDRMVELLDGRVVAEEGPR